MAEPWTEDNPGSVELGCMSTSTSNLSDASSKYWNASTALGTVQGTLVDWVGDAATAWRSSLTTLATSLGESRDRILDGKAAITAYRNATLSISNRASTARNELESALAVYSAPQPNQYTDPTGFAEWEDDRYRAGYREQEARNELYRLAMERYAADEDAIRGLATALPETWSDTLAALASVGIGSVGDLTRSNGTDALLELAQRISAGNAKPEEYEALAMMLGLYEHNEHVMSQLFTELGGEDTVNLVDAIGDWGANNPEVFGAAALALAILVRSGLSTGSQSWSQPKADDFAESMFSGGDDKGDSIAYLFSDVADSALGGTLAIAAANEIDEFERLNHGQWLDDGLNGGLWLGMTEFGDAGNRLSDAAGPIFSTLGQYPDAAYQWLMDAGAGEDRVQYWYHDRYDNTYWSAQDYGTIPPYIDSALDGFQGAADLWFGTQQATGGPIFGGDGPANPEAAADLSSRIIQALVSSERFTANNISDAATASLAAGFVANLPGLAQYPINADYPGELSFGAALAPDGTWTPVLTDDQLAVFMARAGSSESGAALLSFGISSYQETLLNMAIMSGNPNDLNLALDRIVDLQAALEGSTQGQTIETAQGVDADREAVVDSLSLVLGAMPIRGIGDAVAGGVGWVLNWGQGVAIGAVVDGVSTGVSDMWATQTEQALANFAETREGSSEETFRIAMANSLYQYFDQVDPAVLVGIDPPTGDLADWYADNAVDLQTNVAEWNPAGYPDSAYEGNVIDQLAKDYDGSVGDWAARVSSYAGVVEFEDTW